MAVGGEVPAHHFPGGKQQKKELTSDRQGSSGGGGELKIPGWMCLEAKASREVRHYKRDDFCVAWLLCRGAGGSGARSKAGAVGDVLQPGHSCP